MADTLHSAIVTGASRGLGLSIATALAARGTPVALVARGEADLERAALRIRRAGGTALAVPVDLGDPRGARTAAALAAERLGPVGTLVHAASTLGEVPLPLLLDAEPGAFESVLSVNVLGSFRLTRAVAPAMVLRGSGTIVFVSSDAAVEAYPRWGLYGASKAAQDHLARTLAAELADSGVRVLNVDPGEMDTQMHADALPDADRSHLAHPDDVARAVLELMDAPHRNSAGPRVVVRAPARASRAS